MSTSPRCLVIAGARPNFMKVAPILPRAYDVGGPEGITLRQIVADAGEAIDQQVRVISVPADPIMSTLGLVERTGRRLPISAEQVARLMEDKAFDISAARADLDFDPRSFSSGIAQEAVGEH